MRLCYSPNAHALQRREEAAPAGVTEAPNGKHKDQENERQEYDWEEVIVDYQGRRAVR